MKLLPALIFFILAHFASAQVADMETDAEPIGGIHRLALYYYDIEFTPEQRALLDSVNVELAFSVSDSGVAKLENVNGVQNRAIRDSLFAQQSIPPFKPAMQNGIPKPSLYFMRFQYPTYAVNHPHKIFPYVHRKPFYVDDFDTVSISNRRLDVLIGGVMNQFVGKPTRYLALGGGMKIDLTYTTGSDVSLGMSMSFYGNKLREEYPISGSEEQNTHPPTLLIGLTVGRWLSDFHLQFEMAYAIQNVVSPDNDENQDLVQFTGFSPGVVLNRPVRFGKRRVVNSFGVTALEKHALNLHLGARYLVFDFDSATGAMLEFGIGYRLTSRRIDYYRLNEGYYR
ncbi:MAG: hypothetical protein ABR574_03870 [Cryomorphaceae bacterium]|nr:hypothetical protein [Flavobacteriales bacterium]